MSNSWLKKLVPHFIAVVVFAVVSTLYCLPALDGKVVKQGDITHWKGAIQQSIEYKERHGEYPLWTNALFSGMPAFQIGSPGNNVVPWITHNIISLGLPRPIQFFFIAALCFYFLCCVLKIRPVFGILGGLAFAFATYNPVIITAGHDTKMLSIAYMPAVLGSILLIFEKRYWLGAGLTALFTSIFIAMNHPQIAYYFFLAVAIMTIFFIVRWLRLGELRHLIISLAVVLVAGITGVLVNAVTILSTYEYQKETIRGGGTGLTDTTRTERHGAGLDKDYAMSYSMRMSEPFVMMVPRMHGGSTGYPRSIGGFGYSEFDEDKSEALKALRAMPQELGRNFYRQLNLYWGGMRKPGEAGVAGPAYIGAIICFLAIIGMFVLDTKHKWWIFTAVILSIVMSWGSYFEGLNTLFYKYLPLYNKFRAPSMILVIPQLLLPLLAVLCLDRIASSENRPALMPLFKKGLIATASIFAILLLIYVMADYMTPDDKDLMRQVRDANNLQLTQAVEPFFDGLKADRKAMMLGDIFRSFGFIAIAALTLFFAIRNTLSPLAMGIILTVFALIDVMVIDAKYLNKDDYVNELQDKGTFVRTNVDEEILRDTSFYRVFNFAGDAFQENITSYHYNSVGGYHAAKISIYQDLIERQLARQQPNMAVLSMLNTKYFIQKNEESKTQAYQKNDSALGNAWFVRSVKFVKNADEEMAALDNFNPKDTAIVQEKYRENVTLPGSADSTGVIRLIKNDNDIINYTSSSPVNGFAVFSEVFYSSGWKAFIDGKETPIVKVNYVLRGLSVPAGNHNIEFRFEPKGYYNGKTLTLVFSVIMLAAVAAGIFMEWRQRRRTGIANRA